MPEVLVVDDSEIDRTLASRLLEKGEAWHVRHAVDGRAGLDEVRNQPPDVIVTDINMPEMNGLELLNAVVREFPDIPVVLITAKGSEELAMEALAQGAASYVPKKRLSADLKETVDRVWYAATDYREEEQARTRLREISLRFSIEPDLAACMATAKFLQEQLAQMWTCSRTVLLQITTALEEVLTNAYFYGSLGLDSAIRQTDYRRFYELTEQRRTESPYCERRITVEATMDRMRARYIVRDEGPGFDPATLPDHTDADILVRPVGRGIALIKTFMDEVMFNTSGNEITLLKFCPQ